MFLKNKIFKFVILTVFLSVTSLAWASKNLEPIKLKENPPNKYIVEKGDTLWSIASVFLQDPLQWQQIWKKNPRIANPHKIYPGEIFYLIYINDRPQVIRNNNETKTFRLSPKIRFEEPEVAIPTIALDVIAPYLTQNRLLSSNDYEELPYIVGIADERLSAGANDSIYVKGINNKEQKNYGVYKKGKAYKNPGKENKVLGYEAIYLGDARLERFGKPATFYVEKTKTEILRGHKLISVIDEENIVANLFPKPATSEKAGSIVGVLTNAIESGVNYVGTNDVVIIDFGVNDHVSVGDVFSINKKGGTTTDFLDPNKTIKLPDDQAGHLMVFRIFDNLSYALVMDAKQLIKIGDVVKAPEGKN